MKSSTTVSPPSLILVRLDDKVGWHIRVESSTTKCGRIYDSSNQPIVFQPPDISPMFLERSELGEPIYGWQPCKECFKK